MHAGFPVVLTAIQSGVVPAHPSWNGEASTSTNEVPAPASPLATAVKGPPAFFAGDEVVSVKSPVATFVINGSASMRGFHPRRRRRSSGDRSLYLLGRCRDYPKRLFENCKRCCCAPGEPWRICCTTSNCQKRCCSQQTCCCRRNSPEHSSGRSACIPSRPSLRPVGALN